MWPVYCLLTEGLSIDLRKMDLPAYMCIVVSRESSSNLDSLNQLTAYAIRSPFLSVESCVGWPRCVAGEAARIFSMLTDMMEPSVQKACVKVCY